VTEPTTARYRIEAFDPAHHDRASFSSGVAAVDNFFARTANKLARADNLRLSVMVSLDGEIIGFHALNAHSVDYRDLPPSFARTRPGHGQIPAGFISMVGVDRRNQGQGFGGDLLFDCLVKIERASQALGIAVVLLDVLDCGDPPQVERRRRLYASYGFASLPTTPLRMYLPMASVRSLITG
jgi:GNAT superfamily N-acetyltransferase